MSDELDRIYSSLERIEKTLTDKRVEDAEHRGVTDTRLDDVETDVQSVNKKVNIHIDGHTKWLLGTIGLVGGIIAVAQAFK